MRAGRNQPADTGDLTFAILTIWLILFVIGAPPILSLAAFTLGPLPAIDRLIVALVWSYLGLLLISFCIRKQYPRLIWLPGVALAALVVAFQFGA